jgi:hypothetical protein
MTSISLGSSIQVTIFSIFSVIWYIISLEINSTQEISKTDFAVGKTQTQNHTKTESFHCHIKISHSVIAQTQAYIIKTSVSEVDNFCKAFFIASSDPLVSAFKIIFKCFKFPDFILDIRSSNHELAVFFCLSNIDLYSIALLFAISGVFTTCNISHHSITLSSPTIKTGSPGFANFIF